MNLHRIAVLVLFASSLARAQSGECTTTTTVHCTGDAAPYAVPGAVTSAPVAAPAPPPPAYPPPAYYPGYAPMVLDLHKLESDGWRVVQHSDGSLWRERERSTASAGVWGTGLAIFTVSWLATAIGSLESDNGLGPLGFLPVFGAWANAAAESGRDNCNFDYGPCDNHRAAVAGWAIAGIAQAAGFTMFLVGLASGPKKVERQPLVIAPGMVGSGGGLNAVGQF